MRWRGRKHEDFQAELEAHLQLEAEALRAEGLSEEDARATSRQALGNRTIAEERFYESRSWMPAQHLLRDLRFAIRTFRKEPKFSLLTVLGLALGIAVSTALFAFVSASTQIRGFGVRPTDDVLHPETYVSINRNNNVGDFSAPELRYLQEHSVRIAELTAESEPASLVLGTPTASAEAEEILARFESPNFLSVRGFHPALGDSFSDEETRAPLAVLSHSFWHRRFGGDPGVIGQTILLNNHAVTIIGVADPRFHTADTADLFLPIDFEPLLPANTGLMLNARLRPGTGLAQAQTEFQALTASFAEGSPGALLPAGPPNQSAVRVTVFPDDVPPEASRQRAEAVFAIDLAIAMILLIACSNLASLLLARASVRRRELGVRLSLGASRARLISQLLTESLLLAVTGGLLGVLLSTWLARWLLASLPYLDRRPDRHVLFCGLLLSLVTGVSFGLGPALAVTKTNLAQALHSGGTAGTEASTIKVGSRRNLLVVVPLALSLMLLIGAVLLIRAAQSGGLRTSFDSSHLIGLGFRLKDQGYDDTRAESFREELRDRFRVLPGVASVAFTDDSPLFAGSCQIKTAQVARSASVCHRVSPQFFSTVDLRILRGRPFTSADRAGSARVAIVSQSFADTFLIGREPLGATLETVTGSFFEVVGVTADVFRDSHTGPIPGFPSVYIPASQDAAYVLAGGRNLHPMEILVRASADPSIVAAELRQIIRAADPSLWVSIQSFDDYLSRFTNNAHVAIFIFGVLGALVLLLAAAGIYALLAYSVSRRTREIGIRMALGARNREILWLIMRRTLILIAWGIACGLTGAIALSRILAAVVFKTPPPDVPTSIAVALVLAATSLLASYLPARKALRVNPVETLHCD